MGLGDFFFLAFIVYLIIASVDTILSGRKSRKLTDKEIEMKQKNIEYADKIIRSTKNQDN